MEIHLHQTSKIVELNGVPARVWDGTTASGIPVHAYITRIAVHNDEQHEEFERELLAQRAPSEAVQAIPLRLII